MYQDPIFANKMQKSQLCTVSQVPRFMNVKRNGYFSAMATSPLPNGQSRSKLSRASRVNAQTALFDYLHGTRSLHYMDAEHVSKNCPQFLQNLLSEVEDEEDVSRSVTRFLRYNPINEFEPFLESLGLKPWELQPLLPKNLIYLSDDDVFLENYHVLCNYGVPRSKIGKMYKEGMEMFRYDFGVLSSKLHAYEKLGLSQPTVIKLVTCCPALLVCEDNLDFLRVLEELKGLGVELDSIRGSLSDKSSYKWNRILEMLHFLGGLGCNKKDLSMFIKEHPRFVFDDSGKKIYILVVVLLKLGLTREEILLFFERYPRVLTGNFTKNLWKSVQFLAEIGMKPDDIASIMSKHAQALGSCTCLRPKLVLRDLNLSEKNLREAIKKDPSQFSVLTSKRKNINLTSLPKIEGTFLKEKTAFLLKIGFVENSEEMAKALTKFRGRGDQLQERFDCLVNIGLDHHTVSEMIRSVPPVLNQSTDVIQKKLDFLLKHLGYPVKSLAAFPTFLCYNLEKIKLRFSMYKWLKDNGVVISPKNRKMTSSTVALSTLLACSDARFVKYFVDLHPEGPEAWERLKISSSNISHVTDVKEEEMDKAKGELQFMWECWMHLWLARDSHLEKEKEREGHVF